jgi:hypothetical protein
MHRDSLRFPRSFCTLEFAWEMPAALLLDRLIVLSGVPSNTLGAAMPHRNHSLVLAVLSRRRQTYRLGCLCQTERPLGLSVDVMLSADLLARPLYTIGANEWAN